MMAGEWIKVRTNLWDDPRVSQLCDLVEVAEATIIGGLYWLWATADEHTETGLLNGMSVTAIDRKTGIKGFGGALVSIGWLENTPEGVALVRFDEHNGASAKQRATTAKRVASFRNAPNVTDESLQGNDASVTGALAREDKRREEKKDKSTSNSKSKGGGTRGTRLSPDWRPTAEDVTYCKTERPELLPSRVFQNFHDYWIAKAGKNATKVDWSATWRSWVRKERVENAPRPRPAGQPAPPQALDAQRQANTDEAKHLLGFTDDETTDEGSLTHAP